MIAADELLGGCGRVRSRASVFITTTAAKAKKRKKGREITQRERR
jgi:hypothetical protein